MRLASRASALVPPLKNPGYAPGGMLAGHNDTAAIKEGKTKGQPWPRKRCVVCMYVNLSVC